MHAMLANYSVSMSEFKRNPAQVLRSAGNEPVAVLNHNRPAFYMVSPELFEQLLDRMEDEALSGLIHQRLAQKHLAVEVDLDQL